MEDLIGVYNLEKVRIRPFGQIFNLEDRITALEFGYQLFEEIKNIDPMLVSHPIQQL